jgi:polysaccharide deacetylase family protein (PEP-CTERM system associated)
MPTANALSFDIEDWFHVLGIAELEDQDSWDARPSLVEQYTTEILQVCADAGVTATFFILGWVAERYPKLIATIAAEGHELGTHSHLHKLVTGQTRDEFVDDLNRSISAIEAAAGVRVKGYRAPSFSIRPGTEWALEALLDAGIEWDASLYPAKRMNGGYTVNPDLHRFPLDSGRTIPVLPMSVLPLGAFSTGFSGGGYFRLMPMPVIRWGVDRLSRKGRPTVVYLHPRDIAPDVPRVPMPPHRRFMTYVGTKQAKEKLTRLLARFEWTTCGNVLAPLLEGPEGRG